MFIMFVAVVIECIGQGTDLACMHCSLLHAVSSCIRTQADNAYNLTWNAYLWHILGEGDAHLHIGQEV